MADLTFESAVATIVSVKGKIIRALGETFIIVGLSTAFAVTFGTVLGVLLFVASSHQLRYNKQSNSFLDNLVNLMCAFPFVVLTIATIPVTRVIIGTTIGPAVASLVLSVSGLFYLARLVEQDLRGVPKGVIEATSAMGASPMSIICKVLLDGACAGMVSSITVLTIGLLSHSAVAGMIGGGGLGDLAIRCGYYRYQMEVIIFIAAVLVLLVILIQGIGNRLARKLDKR